MEIGANFQEKTKEIDGKVFAVTPFNALQAIKLQAKLLKLIGPSMGGLLDGKSVDDLQNQEINIKGALSGLFDRLDENSLVDLIKFCFARTTLEYEGKMLQLDNMSSPSFDLAFRGTFATVYKVLWFVIEVNYPDFLAIAGDIGSKIKTATSGYQESDEKKSVKR